MMHHLYMSKCGLSEEVNGYNYYNITKAALGELKNTTKKITIKKGNS